jgi:hypothetical protein
MKVNRVVFGWSVFAIVLFVLALVVIIPAFLAGPMAKINSSRLSQSASSPLSSYPSSSASPAMLSSSFPTDDPARDSLPPSILPIVVLRGSDYDMGFQYGEQVGLGPPALQPRGGAQGAPGQPIVRQALHA